MCEISIIVPVYNSEKTLSECILSIIHQTFSNFELLLLDDGSTDNSEMICREYANRDTRIFYHKLPHRGVSCTRSYGLSIAQGNYICFIDSDDTVMADYLSSFAITIKNTDSDICICGYHTVKDGVITPYLPTFTLPLTSKEVLPLLFSELAIEGFLWNKIYRATLLKSDYQISNLHYCEDLVLNTKLFLRHDLKIAFVPKALYNYFQNETSATNTLHFFDQSNHFRYEIAFHEIFSLLQTENEKQCYHQACKKYSDILEHSMYCLLTSTNSEATTITAMKKTMKKVMSKILWLPTKSFRQKIHYFLLAFCPRLYQSIRL